MTQKRRDLIDILQWKQSGRWTSNDFPVAPGNIQTASLEKRKEGLWQVKKSGDTLSVYMTCPWCGGIFDVTGSDRTPGGYSGGCAICTGCGTHIFAHLIGYNETLHRILRQGQRDSTPRDR